MARRMPALEAARLAVCLILMGAAHAMEPQRAAVKDGAGVGPRGAVTTTMEDALTPEEIKEAFHTPADVMEEVKRLQRLGHRKAVKALVDGTSAIALGQTVNSEAVDDASRNFAEAMHGVDFLDVSDSSRPESVRYRKALYVASISSLAAEARARADARVDSESAAAAS